MHLDRCLVETSSPRKPPTPTRPKHPTAAGGRQRTDRRPMQSPMSTAGSGTASPSFCVRRIESEQERAAPRRGRVSPEPGELVSLSAGQLT
jgi:hypothetical protein